MNQHDFIRSAKAVLQLESASVTQLIDRLDETFSAACNLVLDCEGRVIVVGIGKSGHIGNKIAATFASTGTPAFFVHPSEASHGDLGMITPKDLVIAISNSGNTPEILTILPIIKRMGVKLVSLTGNATSGIATQADINLDISVEKEACPLNLAPTASTTTTLAMGDALAVAVLEARNFNEQDFARSHPGGALGKRLLLYVEDLMHKGNDLPMIKDSAFLDDALLEMSQKGLGMTGVVNDEGVLCGIFTDGDLRRTLSKNSDVNNLNQLAISTLMNIAPFTIKTGMLAAELISIMQQQSINGVFIVDDNNKAIGAINMHDLLRAGIV